MKSWRITKYDPMHRAKDGTYTKDDWTSVYQIGEKFNSDILTPEEYLKVEGSYVSIVKWFVEELKIPYLKLASFGKAYNIKSNKIEIEDSVSDESLFFNINKYKKGYKLKPEELDNFIRLILRGYIGSMLKYEDFFIHFGYDYYMYVVYDENEFILDDDEVIKQISEIGLFPEKFISPYLYSDEDY